VLTRVHQNAILYRIDRANRSQVDFEKVVAHVGSKSVASVRERLRLCKKKDIQIEGVVPSLSSPPGGVDKKGAGKVNGSPRKVTGKGKTKPGTKSTVKKEQDDGKESEQTASNGAQMPEVDEGV
jgi:hypothetical protein